MRRKTDTKITKIDSLIKNQNALDQVMQTVLNNAGVLGDEFEKFGEIASDNLNVDNAKINNKSLQQKMGNNICIEFSEKNNTTNKVVLIVSQLGDKTNNVEENFIKKKSPKYFAKQYRSKTVKKNNVIYNTKLVEHLPKKIIDPKIEDNNAKCDLAISTAIQLAFCLHDMKSNQIIWTDLKSENILMRHNGSIGISDTKALHYSNDPPISYRSKNITYEGISLYYTSKAFQEKYCLDNSMNANGFDNKEDNAKEVAAKIWDQEYSYQMGIILYQQLTGQLVQYGVFDKEKNKRFDPKTGFDMSLTIFETPHGKQMARIIKSLTHDDPEKRIHYTNAASQLSILAGNDPLSPSNKERIKEVRELQYVVYEKHTTNFFENRSINIERSMEVNYDQNRILNSIEKLLKNFDQLLKNISSSNYDVITLQELVKNAKKNHPNDFIKKFQKIVDIAINRSNDKSLTRAFDPISKFGSDIKNIMKDKDCNLSNLSCNDYKNIDANLENYGKKIGSKKQNLLIIKDNLKSQLSGIVRKFKRS